MCSNYKDRNMSTFRIISIAITIILLSVIARTEIPGNKPEQHQQNTMQDPRKLSEEEWRNKLTPLQFNVLRQKGTERPFTGQYNDYFVEGVYHCAGCNVALFRSDTKFESGCGWPSFFEPAAKGSIEYKKDYSFGMIRIEVLCANCGGHLGHVFDDGPEPTGKRYCINSVALTFSPDRDQDDTSPDHQ